MDNTLVIYDNSGYIISQMQGGGLREPIGIPFIWVEIPQGKYITGIDVSVSPHVPILADLPKTEVQKLQDENTEIKLALAELAEIVAGGVA